MVIIELDEDAPTKARNTKSSAIEPTPPQVITMSNVRSGHFAGDTTNFCKLVYRILLEFVALQWIDKFLSQRSLLRISSLFLRLDWRQCFPTVGSASTLEPNQNVSVQRPSLLRLKVFIC